MRSALLFVLLTACFDPGTLQLQGAMVDGWDDDAPPAVGVVVETLNDDLEVVDTTESREGGWFRLDTPAGGRVLLVTGGEGYVEGVSFAGQSGLNPRMRIPNGQVFALSEARWQAELARWEGCPGLDQGAIVTGDVRVDGFEDPDVDGLLRVQTGQIRVETAEGATFDACYLNEGGTYDPDATSAGPTARFLVAGIPEGEHLLVVDWVPFEGNGLTANYTVWVPEGGVAPRFPLLVPFE